MFVEIKHKPCNNQGDERHKDGGCHGAAVGCKVVANGFRIVFHHADVWNTAERNTIPIFLNEGSGAGEGNLKLDVQGWRSSLT